jgi:hypothetical protein
MMEDDSIVSEHGKLKEMLDNQTEEMNFLSN